MPLRATLPALSSLIALTLLLAALTVPATAQTGPRVYPGMYYTVEDGTGCTLGYLFEHRREPAPGEPATPPEHYAVTAGHCGTPSGEYQAQWADGEGPVVADPGAVPFGRFVFAVQDGPGAEQFDLGVIKLDAGVVLDPATCYFGGPTHLDTDRAAREGEELHQVGHSQPVIQPRIARAVDLSGDKVLYQGVATFGDSGGPLQAADGGAIGVYSSLRGGDDHPEAPQAASRLSAQLPRAEEAIDADLTLLTAPLAPVSWPLGAFAEEPIC